MERDIEYKGAALVDIAKKLELEQVQTKRKTEEVAELKKKIRDMEDKYIYNVRKAKG